MISLGEGNGWDAAADYDPYGIEGTPEEWRPSAAVRHGAVKILPVLNQVAQELGLEKVTIWLGKIDPNRPERVGCFLNGTASQPALVLFCDKFEDLPQPQPEILLTCLHELAHAWLESAGIDDEHPIVEDSCELFARLWVQNSQEVPNPAVAWLRQAYHGQPS
jgi:hypothetical protein